MDLLMMRNPQMQDAVRHNRVSFPSQAPVYRAQPRADIQWRLAVLYFVRGWSLHRVAARYGMSRERAGQIVKAWRVLAVASGYIQEIPRPVTGVPAERFTADFFPDAPMPENAVFAAPEIYSL